MSAHKPSTDPGPADQGAANPPDDTPEYPLSAPIKPDDPERRTEQSRAETEGCVEEQQDTGRADTPDERSLDSP